MKQTHKSHRQKWGHKVSAVSAIQHKTSDVFCTTVQFDMPSNKITL